MSRENTRMHILDMIESGAINADEGVRLLQDLPPEEEAPDGAAIQLPPTVETTSDGLPGIPEPVSPQSDGASPPSEAEPPEGQAVEGEVLPDFPAPEETERWRSWWMIPFWVGVAITVASGGLLYWAVQAAGVGLGFFLALLPFLAGVLLMVITWQARTARLAAPAHPPEARAIASNHRHQLPAAPAPGKLVLTSISRPPPPPDGPVRP